jgi:hypothetical protein
MVMVVVMVGGELVVSVSLWFVMVALLVARGLHEARILLFSFRPASLASAVSSPNSTSTYCSVFSRSVGYSLAYFE